MQCGRYGSNRERHAKDMTRWAVLVVNQVYVDTSVNIGWVVAGV
jgi:hypothetical protein